MKNILQKTPSKKRIIVGNVVLFTFIAVIVLCVGFRSFLDSLNGDPGPLPTPILLPEDLTPFVLYPKHVAAAITAVEPTQINDIDYLKKFDFTDPQDSRFNPSSDWYVFNLPIAKYSEGQGYVPPEKYNAALQSISESQFSAFTFANRVEGVKSESPEILWMVSELNPLSCKIFLRSINPEGFPEINGDWEGKIPSVSDAPNLATYRGQATPNLQETESVSLPYIEGPGQNETYPFGCVRHGDVHYFYQVLFGF